MRWGWLIFLWGTYLIMPLCSSDIWSSPEDIPGAVGTAIEEGVLYDVNVNKICVALWLDEERNIYASIYDLVAETWQSSPDQVNVGGLPMHEDMNRPNVSMAINETEEATYVMVGWVDTDGAFKYAVYTCQSGSSSWSPVRSIPDSAAVEINFVSTPLSINKYGYAAVTYTAEDSNVVAYTTDDFTSDTPTWYEKTFTTEVGVTSQFPQVTVDPDTESPIAIMARNVRETDSFSLTPVASVHSDWSGNSWGEETSIGRAGENMTSFIGIRNLSIRNGIGVVLVQPYSGESGSGLEYNIYNGTSWLENSVAISESESVNKFKMSWNGSYLFVGTTDNSFENLKLFTGSYNNSIDSPLISLLGSAFQPLSTLSGGLINVISDEENGAWAVWSTPTKIATLYAPTPGNWGSLSTTDLDVTPTTYIGFDYGIDDTGARQAMIVFSPSSGDGALQFMVFLPNPLPPSNLMGSHESDTFPFQRMYYNMLSWNASPSSSAIGYKVFRNGNLIGTTADLNFTDYSASWDGICTYEVKAYDASDRESTAISITVN